MVPREPRLVGTAARRPFGKYTARPLQKKRLTRMRLLLLGGTGQVGKELRSLPLPKDVELVAPNRAAVDLEDHKRHCRGDRGRAVECGDQCSSIYRRRSGRN